jgi:hypothetical protein
MELAMMKAKNVVVGIKNGMTIEDFCGKYQCSPEEFEERMRHLYGHNKKQLKNCLVQIAANEKKARKEVEPESTEVVTETTEADEAATEEHIPNGMSRRVELTYLAELEEQQSQRVMILESEHKGLATEHRSIKTSLRELSDNINRLMLELQAYHQQFEEILLRNADVEARMNQITAEWNTERAALADTRARIDELSVVTLSVYASGEIAPMDGFEIELDDSGWESTREVLLMEDDCQELRLKDIATLARLLMIAEHAEYKIEAMCDNAELEMAFRKMRGKRA